jgi:hypothetical protein
MWMYSHPDSTDFNGYSEDEGSLFLQDIGNDPQDYTTSQTKNHNPYLYHHEKQKSRMELNKVDKQKKN